MIIQHSYLAVSGLMVMIDGQPTGVAEGTQFGQHNLASVKVRLRYIRVLPAYTGRGVISNPGCH